MLGEFLEADLSGVPLDSPFRWSACLPSRQGSKAMFEWLRDFIMEGHTVGELIVFYAEKSTGNGITGTPTEIADFMEEWFEAGAADGFILMLPTLPASLNDFVRLVLPELRRRGLFRDDYEGRDVARQSRLSAPINRYAAKG